MLHDEQPYPFGTLWAVVEALPGDRRAAFAVACAERLLTIAAGTSGDLDVVRRCWLVLDGGEAHLEADHELGAREDLDNDEVACLYYAVSAVLDQANPEHSVWAAQRAAEAAYDRIPDADRSALQDALAALAADSAHAVVQTELAWEVGALELLHGPEEIVRIREQVRFKP